MPPPSADPTKSKTSFASSTSLPQRLARSESRAASVSQTAIDVLSTLSQVTQAVPYLSIISGVLAQVVQIKKDIDFCRQEWEGVMEDIEKIREMVERFREHCEKAGRAEDALPDELKSAFKCLESCIERVFKALDIFCSRSKGIASRVTAVLKRDKHLRIVQQCRSDVARVLNMFNTELQIHQLVKIHELWAAVRPHASLISKLNSPYPDEKLPAPPAILCGRDDEVRAIINMILHQVPAHIAIMGSGGIGKTSVALAVLHSPGVIQRFENRRFFVACDAATGVDALILEILKVFGMSLESGIAPTTKVLAFLEASSCIVCLDNFETPWDADPRAVEAFLAKVTSTSSTVIVTSRGSGRPPQTNWSKPLLPPLRPLTLEAALETWESICGEQDEFAERLVKAVDCVPLAVTLLAHLAESDCAEVVWMLWNKKFTAMVRTYDSDHRLGSMEFSIELSLQNPRIAANPHALQVLGVLCLLPLGIRLASVDAMEDAFEGLLPDILTARLVLMQSSLAYSTDGFMRVLSPIRHYIQKRHRPEEPLLDRLENYYLSVASQVTWRTSLVIRQHIYIELGNIAAVFELSLERSSALPALIEGVLVFSDVCTMLCVYDTKLLTLAATMAAKRAVALEGRCLGRLGFLFYFLDRLEDANDTLQRSIAIHAAAGDRLAHATDLRALARVHIRQKLVPEAEEALLRSAALHVEEDDMSGKAQTLWVLGTLYRRGNRITEAQRTLREALELGGAWCRPDVLLDFGHLNSQIGDFREAERVLLEAAELHARAENQLGRGHDVQRLGYVYTEMGRFEEARARLEEALELHAATGSQRGQAFDYRGLAKLYVRMDRLDDAEAAYRNAAELQRKAGELIAQADTLRDLCEVYVGMGRPTNSETVLRDAIELRRSAGHAAGQAEELKRLGDLYLTMDRVVDARDAYSRAAKIYAETDRIAYDAMLQQMQQLEGRLDQPLV
ncbi:hypothetical protein GGX14DRAFT_112440 [Mycena pura]|uniref:TPR-like protein n=1 Tax=Mycena pura TaxID=153505 RepID=A0AAD6VC55_9AGAR|nr:hypothetical protein GGX14DRAFT_112440 [Mycena pura]